MKTQTVIIICSLLLGFLMSSLMTNYKKTHISIDSTRPDLYEGTIINQRTGDVISLSGINKTKYFGGKP